MIHRRGLKTAIFGLALLVLLSACSLRPERPVPTEQQGEIFMAPTLALPSVTPTKKAKATKEAAAKTEEATCQAILSFLSDLSIPDGTEVKAGDKIDKRWEVENSGDCDWGEGYTVRLVSGDAMGVAEEQSLYPAKAGAKATIQIVFTAPDKPDTYRSAWQAATPNGDLFGDEFYIEVVVTE